MKKIRTKIDRWFNRLKEGWKVLPVKKQRYYMLFLFALYTILSLMVMAKICYDIGRNSNSLNIGHIENPIVKP